jgi:hypothetical protein
MSARRLSRALGFVACAACAAVSFAGCASSGASSSGAGSNGARPHRNNSVITAADMSQLHLTNLYEVVQRLHPEWLAHHNAATLTTPPSGEASGLTQVQVYLDNQRAGNSDVLQQIPISGAVSLRYFDAAQADVRFGNGNLYGVIQVITTGKG